MARKPLVGKANGQGRLSQPAGQRMLSQGGIGFIGRRGFGSTNGMPNVLTAEGVTRLASSSPLELLTLLPEVVPEVGLAVWNGDVLGCGPESVRIFGKTVGAGGTSEEAPEATAAIEALFASLPDEVGDLNDCVSQNYQMTLFAAMSAVECVPGPRKTGLAEVWPIDTLTLRFNRDAGGKLFLEQKQSGKGYVPMPSDRFFWAKLGGIPDNVYGSAPLAPALSATLLCLTFLRDLVMAVHRIGFPKYDVGFDFEAHGLYAKDVLGLTEAEDISDYVDTKFSEYAEYLNTLEVDDAFLHDIKSEVKAVGAGDSFADVAAIWEIFRSRLIQALKQNPTLMGIVEGSTETWSVVEWDIFSRGLHKVVSKAVKPLVKAANLHLRLLGMPFVADVEFKPIRSIQRLQEAQAEGQEIENEIRKRDEGLQDQDTTGMKLTGSAPVAPGPVRLQGDDPANGSGGDEANQQGGTRSKILVWDGWTGMYRTPEALMRDKEILDRYREAQKEQN